MENINVDSIEHSVEVDGGNLPSAVEETKNTLDGFKITDEIQAKYFKEGKLYGRFDNISGMAEALKSVEDKYSATMRDIKSGKYQEVAEVVPEPVDVMVTAKPLIDKFVQNGMVLTDEILEEAKASGLDIRDVKLAAIEMKEAIGKAHSYVGGAEEYNSMVAWAKESLDDASKISFDKDLSTSMSKYAIQGLYAEYKANNGVANVQTQRIMGDTSGNTGVKPYANTNEILRDNAYINSPQGRNDSAAKALYNKRIGVTPDKVIYGR